MMPRTKKPLTVKANAQPKPKAKVRRSTKGGDVKAEGATATAKAPRNTGIRSGMKIMQYQDHTLATNHKSDRRLSEQALADDWAQEFPQSDCMQRRDTKIVASVRRLYNQGRHTKSQGGVSPDRLSVPYGNDGKPITAKATKKDATEKAA
jgi:hypothetical protein